MSPRRSRRGGIHGPVAVPGARLRPGRRDCDWYTGQRDHGYSSTTYLTVSVQLSRLLDAHQIVIRQTRKLARRASEMGDDGTNDLLVSDVLRTNELQVWFVSEHLVDVPLIKAQATSSGVA